MTLPDGVIETLRRNGVFRTSIDDSQSIVVFGFDRTRTWVRYIYTKNELLPLYSRPVELTPVDIEMWGEIIDIAKQGPDATPAERQSLVFDPRIAHPYLVAALGNDVVARIGSYASEGDITDEDKAVILDALNEQRRVASRLIEHPEIWFEEDAYTTPLHVEANSITERFWVTELIKQLLKDGTLLYAEDGRHLRIKEELSLEEERAVEWVHVGLIEFIYGNLISKDEIAYQKSLGNGWYFNVS